MAWATSRDGSDVPGLAVRPVHDRADGRPGVGARRTCGESLRTARVNALGPVSVGDRIELGVDTRNLHFFDPDSGLAVRGTK